MKKQIQNTRVTAKPIRFFDWEKVITLTILIASGTRSVYAQGQQQYNPGIAPNNQNAYPSNDIINNNYNANPVANSYSNPFAGLDVPKYHPNFWNQTPVINGNSAQRIIDANVVINGILQEDISSKKSKAGDVFSIMLPDDYKVNDLVMIPKNSKFVGTVVTATPAKGNVNGVPGNLQVSIQTLVSPRGISIPINCVIEYDPSQHTKLDVKKSRGIPVGEWAKSAEYGVYYTAGSIGSRLGVPFFYKKQTTSGSEFAMSKGELLPVKLSQSLDATPLAAECQQQSGPQQNTKQNTQQEPHWQTNGASSPNSNVPRQTNGQPGGQNNMLPGFASPAGPEPF